MKSALTTSISSLFLPTTTVFSTLGVTGGLHRGVVIALEQPVCRIGSSPQADVILSDGGIAAEHVTLRFHARMVAIEAQGGDVEVGDRCVMQGTGWRTNLPTTIAFGDVRLQLSQPALAGPPVLQAIQKASAGALQSARNSGLSVLQSMRKTGSPALESLREAGSPVFRSIGKFCSPVLQPVRKFSAPAFHAIGKRMPELPEPLRSRLNRRTAVTALGATMFATMSMAGVYPFISTDNGGVVGSAYALRSSANSQAAEAALAASSATPGEALRQQLSQANLDGLQVQDSGSHLIVSGEFAPERYADWTDVQRWFDRHYGSSHVLISNAQPSLAADKPAFEFRAVWLGDNPYVIGPSGRRLYPGATLREGWVLSEISDKGVMLRRGDDEFTLTL
ncbi:Inner membrane component of T3SS [Modicisalibacter muralis]|uniref:Inner membrane component of T3SS n=1 Tax=Modicisalibacter muralis TaxID=119000 RepID=A0A1G9NKI1_9GAMM|nr:EscD/YscD/HrpQ family type III secretion system periplasmic domain-containing protein [Halomonas muralis]SDL86495.1 Inner membrane component of T3SS [Halomonas muralis]